MNSETPIYYAGIGARKTPEDILRLMTHMARELANAGLILRSGGAHGADAAFEEGATPDQADIFLPWKGHNGHSSPLHRPLGEAFNIASYHHPAWYTLSPGVQQLHARNAHVLLGANLQSPVKFVLCWTPHGAVTGGTGLGLRIANTYGIPIFNLGNQELKEIGAGVNKLIGE